MKQKVALLGVFANLVLTIGKFLVALLSGSASVMAEAIHSGVDIVSSLIGFIGVRMSGKPEDEKHPYGHHKFDALGSGLITLILLVTGAGIVYESYGSLMNPEKASIGWLTLLVMGLSAIINEVVARIKIYYGKKENSLILVSDGVHSRVDVFSSIGVFVGLVFVKYFIYADAILALLIGLYIIYESIGLAREAMGSLLDEAADEEVNEEIRSIARKMNVEIDDLKTQKRGAAVSADFDILLNKDLTVKQAEELSVNLRENLIGAIENLKYVSIGIKSHDIESNFVKGVFGKTVSWRRTLGKNRQNLDEGGGRGPMGNCVCPSCGYKVTHERGVPCSKTNCPKCHAKMVREDA
jgi:cation diffusion facilitator family transporter